jgi:mannose-6-phosphate isomerase
VIAVYPLLMEPAIHAMPWGGTRLRDELGKIIPDDLALAPIGESWEVSAHPNGVSRVANGPLAGMPLPEVLRAWGASLLGEKAATRYGGVFPLLVKLIEVNSLASVQVHPDDEQARRLEGFPFGKSEAWYIIETLPGAEAYIGFRAGTDRERFQENLACCSVRDILRPVALKAGDCAALEPGTVHACGKGILLLEIQQSCDITYRVYDWDRRDEEGRARPLHIEKALQVIDFTAQPRVFRAEGAREGVTELFSGRHFGVFQATVKGTCTLPRRESFCTLTVISGACTLESAGTRMDLRRGQSVLVPAGLACQLSGGEALLMGSTPSL